MSGRAYQSESGSELRAAIAEALHEVESRYSHQVKIPDYFVNLIRRLQDVLPIGRAFLAVRELLWEFGARGPDESGSSQPGNGRRLTRVPVDS